MAISLDIKSELPQAIAWTNEHTKQLPFSIAQALTASVKGINSIPSSKRKSALNAISGSSSRFLDRPKPGTVKGMMATTANKRTLQSLISPKTRPWDRNRYLAGNILGTDRAPKPYEIALANKSRGVIAPGTRFVPTGAIKQDSYGNISKANLRKIINSVGNSSGTGNNIFIGKPVGDSRPLGVYRRERNSQLRPLFLVDNSLNYRAIFPVERIVKEKVVSTFGIYLRDRLSRNVRASMRSGTGDGRTGLF